MLDVGSGLGGSARYLAAEHGCRATGIDLTQEYVDTANALAKMVGLDARVNYRAQAPWTSKRRRLLRRRVDGAVQMNIEDKRRFYGEIARVLTAGGRLIFTTSSAATASCITRAVGGYELHHFLVRRRTRWRDLQSAGICGCSTGRTRARAPSNGHGGRAAYAGLGPAFRRHSPPDG